ncbi:hypothetical protein FACS189429_7210 [Bacteroidia bacterium]|nr:hypothetical protein FACS189429_7210 [Bacteroidia bacterium]
MLQIDNTIISFDLLDECFACNLQACGGQCCVDGEEGAPLLAEEVAVLEKIAPVVVDFLPEKSRQTIAEKGVAYIDPDGEPVTMLVEGNECAFVYHDENGCAKCAIEKAYKAGKIDFYKPISCHLYPVRLQNYNDFIAVNYHQWSICKCARNLGKAQKMPVFQFLKEPLIRRFGKKWFEELEQAALLKKEFVNS